MTATGECASERPACGPDAGTSACASLDEQVARYAEDLAAVIMELRSARHEDRAGGPEREVATRLQDGFDDMLRSLGSFGFLVADQFGHITHATRQSEKLFGMPMERLIGRRLADIVRLPGSRSLAMALQELLDGQSARIDRLAVRAVGGTHEHLLLHALRADYPAPGSMLCLLRPAATAHDERPVEHLLLADVFAGVTDAWMVADRARRIVGVNPGFTAVTGYEPYEVIGRTPGLIASGRQDPAFYARMWEALDRTGEWQGEVCNRRRNGELYEEWLHISAVSDEHGHTAGYVALFYDLVFARKACERIDYLVHTGGVTGLPNRALFLDRLGQAVRRARSEGRPFGVLALDVDQFKEINDTRGHAAGDGVLAGVAQHLRQLCAGRMLAARLGGDEFVVLAEGEQAAALETLCADLHALLRAPASRPADEPGLTVSCGVSYFPGHGEDASTLLRNAEIALGLAKRGGGGATQVYHDEFSRRRIEQVALTKALRKALDRQQFHLVYQPQVDAHSRAITGVEALLRWRLPEQGEISPAQFIPLAEETGLIVPIGAWVLEQACRQQVAWRQAGLPALRMAVNIAGRQLREPGFCTMVAAVVARSGIAPQELEIEITESELMGEVDVAAAALARLRGMGIGIAVDDFGTGHSSLGRLHALAVDRLKVDRSFVQAMESGERAAAIPRAILALADSLGLASVAEGVETEAQASLLREWGCQEMQGYLFSRPVPAETIAALLA